MVASKSAPHIHHFHEPDDEFTALSRAGEILAFYACPRNDMTGTGECRTRVAYLVPTPRRDQNAREDSRSADLILQDRGMTMQYLHASGCRHALGVALACVAAMLLPVASAQPPKATQKDKVNTPQPTPTGAKTGLIPRDVLFGNPDKASPRLSPDGKYLSYLAPVNGVLNVWVGPADKPEEAKAVSKDKKRGIRMYLWAYTGRHVLYIQDNDGDEDFHVYCVDLKENSTRDLTPLKKIRAQINGVDRK